MSQQVTSYIDALSLSLRNQSLRELLERNLYAELAEKYSLLTHGDAGVYYKYDAFDARHFQKPVVKVDHVFGSNADDLQVVIQKLLQLDAKYFVFRLPQVKTEWVQAIERNGGLFLDTSIHLSSSAKKNQKPSAEGLSLVPFSQKYTKQTLEIAEAFCYGRFFTEPTFQGGSQAYLEWLQNSIDGKAADEVLLAIADDLVQAVVTLKHEAVAENAKLLHIPLLAKHPQSKKSGLAGLLIDAALEQAMEKKVSGAVISTQATNLPALRAYIDAGFKPFYTEVIMRILVD